MLISTLLIGGCNRGNEPGPAVKSESAESTTAISPAVTAVQARAIAGKALIYGFPMVVNYKAMYNYVLNEESPDYKGPFNQKACDARVFTPDDKAVVTPNSDTPYCMFWIDLRSEPMVLTVPEIEQDRFYHFQFVDLYTHNSAYVGTLETGNGAGSYLVTGPDWDGNIPEGIDDIIRSETAFVFIVVRTQLFNPGDLEMVREIQQSYNMQLLSTFAGTPAPAVVELPDFPEWVEGSQFDERFFGYLDFMMSLLGKPGEGEQPLWDALASLGIGPENTFDYALLSIEKQDALKAGIRDGFGEIEQFIQQHKNDPLVSAKIFGTREFLTQSARAHYGMEAPDILRSVAADRGLFGNSAVEAIYPTYLVDADQQPLDTASNRYSLTFEKGKLPPVRAFWSLTMYDGKTQLFIENPLDRYLLNSTMMDQYKLEADGSLVLHITKESPGEDLEDNWLPAPDGPFYMVLRLYGPKAEALEGAWTPPPVQKAN